MSRFQGDKLARQDRFSQESGSVVLLAVFVCAVAVVSVQVVTACVVIGARALAEETSGRDRLAAVDAGLESARAGAAASWLAAPWGSLVLGDICVSERLVELEGACGWVLEAQVESSSGGPASSTLATVERGRDGVDLPLAAVVADRVRVGPGRAVPWLIHGSSDPTGGSEVSEEYGNLEDGSAVAYLGGVEGEVMMGAKCAVESLGETWSVGEGWRAAFEDTAILAPRVYVVRGEPGQSVPAPDGLGAGCAERPVMCVTLGGCQLDIGGLGELWAVIVADDGSVLMEGTRVHGAVFATGTLDVGSRGQVVYDHEVWRWARDRSLLRVRLVPGTRREDME